MYNPLIDIDFIEKRIKEQENELSKLDVTTDRGKIMYESALSQLRYFQSHLRLMLIK